MSEWTTIATTGEIQPGERMVVELGYDWVVVFNVNGQFYAIKDLCTHDDGPLAEGELNEYVIECPRHGATFDIRNGKVLSAPAYTDVPVYEIQVINKSIQIRPKT